MSEGEKIGQNTRPKITERNFLSFPLDAYELMHPDDLKEVTRLAGHKTPEDFLTMIRRGKQKSVEHAQKKQVERAAAEEVREKYKEIPPHARAALKEMYVSEEALRRAEALDTEAHDLFGGSRDKESHKKFMESQRITTSRRFAELCNGRTMRAAFKELREEKNKEALRTNLPHLRDAIASALNNIDRWINHIENQEKAAHNFGVRGGSSAYGPAEVFEIETQKRRPVNPRSPHRQNDELKGY